MGVSLLSPAIADDERWELMNGDVQLSNPMEISLSDGNKVRLDNPELIGAGGGGAVFAFEDSSKLIKVSWSGSTKTVRRECQTLQHLQRQQVTGAERCLASLDYPEDNRRAMILVEPYMKDAVASVGEVSTKQARAFAVEQISQTLVQMLAANTITIDVQPLISKETGEVIFIDMTEAQVLKPPFSFLDRTLLSSFCSEMVVLIPDEYMKTATKTIENEIQLLKEQRGIEIPADAIEVLRTFF